MTENRMRRHQNAVRAANRETRFRLTPSLKTKLLATIAATVAIAAAISTVFHILFQNLT